MVSLLRHGWQLNRTSRLQRHSEAPVRMPRKLCPVQTRVQTTGTRLWGCFLPYSFFRPSLLLIKKCIPEARTFGCIGSAWQRQSHLRSSLVAIHPCPLVVLQKQSCTYQLHPVLSFQTALWTHKKDLRGFWPSFKIYRIFAALECNFTEKLKLGSKKIIS